MFSPVLPQGGFQDHPALRLGLQNSHFHNQHQLQALQAQGRSFTGMQQIFTFYYLGDIRVGDVGEYSISY